MIKGLVYIAIFAGTYYASSTYLHAPYFLCLVLGFVGIFAWRGLWATGKKK